MKRLTALLAGLGMLLAVSAPASAESLWCEIKRNVCEQGSTNQVCIYAYQYCPD
ncbi:hypothetical protein N8I74_10800 [Chitiniphilus purpureus]|uniref:Uncharacterized protein n=1 Tax=Chitiniphilus purpureus TaxID=2981137 RepID=A0ABY6DHJ7_9NEIS|nr:hypothetical protein [Chitiniphilus sp. CD1]UXY13810.1 hypothetical protein N8I74_10800 [Chitiniphilus sp. CD1]